ncbi:TfuA-like protein [Sorangium sp. So ce260]|uniref:hypothetical protein n=1 Tax=Sorangium sp. So ce260 TaxID=3133291 RepID=UPI003F5D5DD1
MRAARYWDLGGADAKILAAEYRPPIRRADIDALRADLPHLIGIVDGLFPQSLAVSPKEILGALRAGVTVLGSSSRGLDGAADAERARGVGRTASPRALRWRGLVPCWAWRIVCPRRCR